MKFNLNEEINKDSEKKIEIIKEIKLTPNEAKEKIVYKDANGSCLIIDEGKEKDGVILSLSSNGHITVGVIK